MTKLQLSSITKWAKNMGPGPIIAAGFIGPGTVTLCTLTGVQFGYSLLWAIVLSIATAIFLQEMAVRIGIFSRKSMTGIIRDEIKNPILKTFVIGLIFSAIIVGNSAYEAGNLSGGVLGLETITGQFHWTIGAVSINVLSILIGLFTFLLLYLGNYKVIERILVGMVLLMSISFLATTLITKPDFSKIFSGIFSFTVPSQSLFTIIGLVGTTIVPYNLFLHSSLVQQKWNKKSDLKIAVTDMVVAIGLGGITSLCIIITAAAADIENVTNAADLAIGLEPLLGSYAKYILGIGLFAAGISSSITAPLAAAYVACGCFKWEADLQSKKFRGVWISVLALGVLCSAFSVRLITVIQFAQITNGLLLPIIVAVLVWLVNRTSVLGEKKNTRIQNVIGIVIIVIAVFLGIKSILAVWQ